MFNAETRQHRCCFTGHRPEKLDKTEQAIKVALEKEIKLAIQSGYNVYLTGMARGADLWAAEIVLTLSVCLINKSNRAGNANSLIFCRCWIKADPEAVCWLQPK